MCALQWTGVPYRVYSHLMPNVFLDQDKEFPEAE